MTPFTVNVEVFMVEGSSASENIAVINVFTDTPVALPAGLVSITEGDVVSVHSPVSKKWTTWLFVSLISSIALSASITAMTD